MKFRFKPLVIEAVCWNGATLGLTSKPVDLEVMHDPEVRLEKPEWLPACGETLPTSAATRASVQLGEVRRFEDLLYIGTPLGTMAAEPGDWIVRTAQGEIYPCKPEIFAATYDAYDADRPSLTDAQVEHMVSRFLAWRLPEDFNPDDGISFKPMFNEHTDHPSRHEPSGTNLFDAVQATAMVRHMIEILPKG